MSDTDKELKACPFCGGEAKVGMANVWCGKCQAELIYDYSFNREQQIQRWNTRTPSPDQQGIEEEKHLFSELLWWYHDNNDIPRGITLKEAIELFLKSSPPHREEKP